jgi:hypothetical protein
VIYLPGRPWPVCLLRRSSSPGLQRCCTRGETSPSTAYKQLLCCRRTCLTGWLAGAVPSGPAHAECCPWLGPAYRLGLVLVAGLGTSCAAPLLTAGAVTFTATLDPLCPAHVDCADGRQTQPGALGFGHLQDACDLVGAPPERLGEHPSDQGGGSRPLSSMARSLRASARYAAAGLLAGARDGAP